MIIQQQRSATDTKSWNIFYFFLINQQLIELSRFQYAMLLIATDLELSMKGSNHIDGQVIMGRQ